MCIIRVCPLSYSSIWQNKISLKFTTKLINLCCRPPILISSFSLTLVSWKHHTNICKGLYKKLPTFNGCLLYHNIINHEKLKNKNGHLLWLNDSWEVTLLYIFNYFPLTIGFILMFIFCSPVKPFSFYFNWFFLFTFFF